MPIKPEQKALYPKNWKAIRASILERAEHKCETCGVANYEVGFRDMDGAFWTAEEFMSMPDPDCGFRDKPTKIVLTIAHLDHDPTHNDPSNLKALCQKCHLNYDHELHMKNSRVTREQKKGLINLFEL